jgi:hypothetical protein
MCARCNKPVQRFEWSLCLERNQFEVRVSCHGEIDKCYLDRDFPEHQIAEAWAFKPALKAPEPKALPCAS